MSQKAEEEKMKQAKKADESSENAKKRPRPASVPFASGKLAAMAKRQKKATKSKSPAKKKAKKVSCKEESPSGGCVSEKFKDGCCGCLSTKLEDGSDGALPEKEKEAEQVCGL